MDLKKLQLFTKVVTLKSFTRAAEAAQLSQPTISEHIRSLEEELGLKLVDRRGREIEATPAGVLLQGYAEKMLRLERETVQAIARFSGNLSGDLHISASSIPGTFILPALLGHFCARHPSVRPIVERISSREVAARVQNNATDLGLVGALWNERSLDWEALFPDTLLVALSPHHPLAALESIPLDKIFSVPFILREPGSGTRRTFATLLEQQGYKESDLLDIAILGGNDAIKEAVKANLGIAVLSARSIAEEMRMGLLKALPIEGMIIDRPIYLLQRKNKELSPVATVFLDFLRTTAQQENLAGQPLISPL